MTILQILDMLARMDSELTELTELHAATIATRKASRLAWIHAARCDLRLAINSLKNLVKEEASA